MRIQINKSAEIAFGLKPLDFVEGSTFIFMGKRSRQDPDSDAVFVKSSGEGILFEPISGKGLITLNPADTLGASEGTIDCDLQMIAPSGAVYLVGEFQLRLILPVNLNTIS